MSQVQNPFKSDIINVGMIIPFAGNGNIPVGYLLCNGASVGKATYPALFDVIGYTYGGSGDNFNLPDLRDKFIEGSTTGGVEKEAGLPNITGETTSTVHSNASYSPYSEIRSGGAFSDGVKYVQLNGGNANTMNVYGSTFDASRSSSIYGKSTTVQPPALTMRYIIKAFAGAAEDTTDVEVTRLANDIARLSARKINGKALSGDITLAADDINSTDGTVQAVLDALKPYTYVTNARVTATPPENNVLYVDTANPTSYTNRTCRVIGGMAGAPTDMAWGIRQVFYVDADFMVVVIFGVTTTAAGGNPAAWVNVRPGPGTVWKDWHRF